MVSIRRFKQVVEGINHLANRTQNRRINAGVSAPFDVLCQDTVGPTRHTQISQGDMRKLETLAGMHGHDPNEIRAARRKGARREFHFLKARFEPARDSHRAEAFPLYALDKTQRLAQVADDGLPLGTGTLKADEPTASAQKLANGSAGANGATGPQCLA